MADHIFLYGTLQMEIVPPDIARTVARLRPVGPGQVQGLLYDLGPYPGLVPRAGLDEARAEQVRGTVYRLPPDPAVLRRLDRYEGFDPPNGRSSLFRRVSLDVSLEEGQEVSAWVYVYNRDPGNAPLVPGGDYLAYRRAQHKLR